MALNDQFYFQSHLLDGEEVKMFFYARFYGKPEKIAKINAASEQEAMEKIFGEFPEHAETEGEDIEFVLSEKEFISEGHKVEEATIFIE